MVKVPNTYDSTYSPLVSDNISICNIKQMHATFLYMGVSDNNMNMQYKTYARHVLHKQHVG